MVIPELFTNVCTVAMLLPRILVLSQQLNQVLCLETEGRLPAVWLIHGGVIHVDDGYTWVSQNTNFGLNVVLGSHLVGNNDSAGF